MWSSHACELEVDVSAMIDGELDLPSMLAAVDHLEDCPSCRSFYRAARSLERHLDVTSSFADASMLVSAEAPIAANATTPRANSAGRRGPDFGDGEGDAPRGSIVQRLFGSLRPSGWTWGAAAVVAVLFVVVLTQTIIDSDFSRGQLTNVVLEGSPEDMDDVRFRELVTELLQSDRKYHRAMLHALRDVEQLAYIPEGSAELPRTAPLQ